MSRVRRRRFRGVTLNFQHTRYVCIEFRASRIVPPRDAEGDKTVLWNITVTRRFPVSGTARTELHYCCDYYCCYCATDVRAGSIISTEGRRGKTSDPVKTPSAGRDRRSFDALYYFSFVLVSSENAPIIAAFGATNEKETTTTVIVIYIIYLYTRRVVSCTVNTS